MFGVGVGGSCSIGNRQPADQEERQPHAPGAGAAGGDHGQLRRWGPRVPDGGREPRRDVQPGPYYNYTIVSYSTLSYNIR